MEYLNVKLTLGSLFLCVMILPLTAMDSHPKKQTLESKNHAIIQVRLDGTWLENQIQCLKSHLPDQISLLDYNDAITAELLGALNPEWIALKETLSAQQKSELLHAALNYSLPDSNAIERTLIATAACIGADPNPDPQSNMECYIGGTLFLVSFRGMSALDESILFDDYQLVKYLLEKGANPNISSIKHEYALHHANSVEIAKLLFKFGAIAPHDLVYRCTHPRYRAQLMEFYLDKVGPQTDFPCLLKIPLHGLMKYEESKKQIRKAHLLLNAGLDSCVQDLFGNTVFHCAAQNKWPQFCSVLVAQFVQAHHHFLEFLWLLKENFSRFYEQKDVKKLCFKNLSPIRKLRAILEMKNKEGQTAYDVWAIEKLNPDTCSYRKFIILQQENSQ
jgi:ankyrin repeat protein